MSAVVVAHAQLNNLNVAEFSALIKLHLHMMLLLTGIAR